MSLNADRIKESHDAYRAALGTPGESKALAALQETVRHVVAQLAYRTDKERWSR